MLLSSQHISMPPSQHISMPPSQHISMPPSQHISMPPSQHISMPPSQHISMPPSQHISMPPSQHISMPPSQHMPLPYGSMRNRSTTWSTQQLLSSFLLTSNLFLRVCSRGAWLVCCSFNLQGGKIKIWCQKTCSCCCRDSRFPLK